MELATAKKNHVSLSDYDYQSDIENRLVLSSFNTLDLLILEEILFSPIRTSLEQIAQNLDVSEKSLAPTLQKLQTTRLFTLENGQIVIDKERRKYFELILENFQENFAPGMETVQHLLKKVPIHILPQWYAISRSSDNIFASIVEKYLITPQIFQRHLRALPFSDPILIAMTQDLLAKPPFEILSQTLQEKYHLSPREFQEAVLNLEFHFIGTLRYQKIKDRWHEVVTLFHEWKEYLSFLHTTTATPIASIHKIQRKRSSDFAFVEEMQAVLKSKKPSISLDSLETVLLRITQMGLAHVKNKKLTMTDRGLKWLNLEKEAQALELYRARPAFTGSSFESQEKAIHDAEKSILRILNSGWVFLSDFLQGVAVPLNEGQNITLRKGKKGWQYGLPIYSQQDLEFIQKVVMEHLFEAGMVALGSCNNKPCLTVTPFGQSFFG